jgi:hypothetical protein
MIDGTGGAGNIAWFCTSDYAASGEAYTVNSGAIGSDGTPQLLAVTATSIYRLLNLTAAFTAALADDFFGLEWVRDADDAGDTAGNTHSVFGLLIVY